MMSSIPGWALVALGSAAGGVLRYGVGLAGQRWLWMGLPWATLLVNILGCAAIGALAGASEKHPAGDIAQPLLVIGLLGGFTTFSAFGLQTLKLLQDGQWPTALTYVMSSTILSIGAAAIAYKLFS